MDILANNYSVVTASPDAAKAYCYTPGILRLPDGALLVTMDFGGPDLRSIYPDSPVFDRLPPMHYISPTCLGKAFLSYDNGTTWQETCEYPLCHARPFLAGNAVYIIGHHGDLGILRSEDNGRNWGPVIELTSQEIWHQSACNVWQDHGFTYLVMEKLVYTDLKTWPIAAMAPVLFRGHTDSDLTRRESWTRASEMVFRDIYQEDGPSFFGFPYYSTEAPMGWLETNVVRITNPSHTWFDPKGRTLHLLMRMHTGTTGYAGLLKVVEQEDGSMLTQLQTTPSGKDILYLPMPGGQMKFHVVYDQNMALYWLLSSQATNSMVHKDQMLDGQIGPNNQRNRLVLHFSRNCVDWCFAGVVSIGESERCSRHYASMIIDGDDLLIASRSGDQRARNAHDGNLITFHRVSSFRSLVY